MVRRAAVALPFLLSIAVGCSGDAASPRDAASNRERERAGELEEWEQLTPAEAQQRQEQHQRDSDALMSVCMADEGFEWVPLPPPPTDGAGAPSPDEYRARYGFGISTLIVGDPESPAAPTQPDAPLDPALPGEQGLSPEEASAYRARATVCFDRVAEELPMPGMHVVRGGIPVEQIEEQVDTDSRVVAAQRRWSDCMSAQGFEAASRDQLLEDIESRAEPFRQKIDPGGAGDASGGDGPGRDTPGGGAPAGPPRLEDVLSPEEMASLTSLQQYELQAAAADHQCGAELSDVTAEVFDEAAREWLEGS